MLRHLFRHCRVHLVLIGLEARLQGHDLELYRVEFEPQRALEHLFEQRPEISFRLEHVAVGDAHRDLQFDAVFVDDERDFAGLDAFKPVECFLHEPADDAESRLAAAALLAAQGYLAHRVAAQEQHRERADRENEIKHTERDDQSAHELIVKLGLLDAAECGDDEDDDQHEGNDQTCGRKYLFYVFFHIPPPAGCTPQPLRLFRANSVPVCSRSRCSRIPILFFI